MLAAAPERHDVLAVPRNAAASSVSARILADPADSRTLGEWAGELGVSSETLTRAFVADPGITLRTVENSSTHVRVAGDARGGEGVNDVAPQVGYRTSSGFIAAFRETFGTTPARYGVKADAVVR
ncbi:AraC family transcriptional regulator [Rhodococcus erythropolis]|uniref:AraC family transcriptional regulator n=1 Tax=Rhodococcus erythropolis TaxID=1833 RepID=UPI0029490E9A|nr:AraC family transcriptional regulator [Rhodococcus erythropolis]MDV6276021.1 AraC family transcriptional regulator [Rhodococcus erythropolis]